MADGNILASLGVDPQLLTAGSLGGLVKAIFDRTRVIDGMLAMAAGGATANYLADAVVQLSASIEIFGGHIALNQRVSAFLVGMFAVLIVSAIANLLRSKIGGNNDQRPGGNP